MTVLGIGAHPDDLEILCGGTLARLADEGHEVHLCVLTDGSLGSPDPAPEQTAAQRYAEAAAATAVIGGVLHWVGEPDGFLCTGPPQRRAVVEVIRRAQPDLMIIHSAQDYHPDHRAASQLAVDARLLSTASALPLAAAALTTPPQIWFMDTLGSAEFLPETWVDTTAVADRKAEMIACHRSQNDLMRAEAGFDYVDLARRQGSARGLQCGTEFAEAFRALTTFPSSPGCLLSHRTDLASEIADITREGVRA